MSLLLCLLSILFLTKFFLSSKILFAPRRFQLAVTIGIFAAQAINLGTTNLQPWGWRLSLALGAIPAVLLFVGSLILPDTPNSLIERGKAEEGRKILEKVRGTTGQSVFTCVAGNLCMHHPKGWLQDPFRHLHFLTFLA